MQKIKIILVAGARPNFMKIAPIMRAIDRYNSTHIVHLPDRNKMNSMLIKKILVHTGQHFDDNMSEAFFADLAIPKPDYYLGCRSGTHAEQTAKIMVEFEKVCLNETPDYILVVGDVNSTLAASLVAKKLNVRLLHVEAGLRSGNRSMPEEINRLATDAITDIFFTTEKSGSDNLLKEGHDPKKIYFVGHVMIDNLLYQTEKIKNFKPSDFVYGIKKRLPQKYFCMTLHRPSNVDNKNKFFSLINSLIDISKKVPIIFCCHPRTEKMLLKFQLGKLTENFEDLAEIKSGLFFIKALGYNNFLYLLKDCTGVITDSGGLQEETTALKIPCLTLRKNTERPITVEEGSNVMIGENTDLLKDITDKILCGNFNNSSIPALWDGNAGVRIVKCICDNCLNRKMNF